LPSIDPTLKHAITPPAFDRTKLHREGLVDRIHAVLDRPLVVVAAPAGYGKTTLLSDLTAHTETRVCWVRLTEGNNDTSVIAEKIVESIKRVFRKARRAPLVHFSGSSPAASIARILAAWIDTVISEAFVLIIDDVQYLGGSKPQLEFIDELVRIRPSAMCLVVSGREVPDLSLARLLAEGQLAGFGPHDLALTRDEVAALLATRHGEHLEPSEVDHLYETSRGWVTGVVLSESFSKESIGGLASEGSLLVYEYLSSVVLNRLPDELRRFALDVSVLPLMTGDLCNSLLQQPATIKQLRYLAHKGAFVDVTEGDVPTFVFHDLFRSFLSETQSRSNPSRQKRLKSRAGTLLEREGVIDAAFRLYVESGQTSRAARIAEKNASKMARLGRVELLEHWWRYLESRAAAPELLLALASVYVDRGELQLAEDVVSSASRHLIDQKSMELSARLSNLRSALAYRRGFFEECLSMAETVLAKRATLHRSDTVAYALEMKALALAAKRTRIDEAKEAAQEAVTIASNGKDRHILARATANLGYVLEAEGDLRTLATVIERAWGLLADYGSARELAYALNNLADARHKQGDYEAAMSTYGEALRNARQAAHPVVEAYILFGQGDVFNDVGMAMQSAQLYDEALAISARIENPQLIRYGCLQTSVLYRRRGNMNVSKEWMRRVVESEGQDPRSPSTTVQLAALESLVAPGNAIRELSQLLRGKGADIARDVEVLAKVFLARAYFLQGERDHCRESVQASLSTAGIRGAEQAIAAEINSDRGLRELYLENAHGNAVLDVVLGRVEAMGQFRRLHHEQDESGQEYRPLRVVALGPGRILLEGKPLSISKRQPREVFHYLIDKKSVSKELLAEVFWSRHLPGRRAASIHAAIHAIRAALGKEYVLLEDGVYSLAHSLEIHYDVDRFEKAAEIAERLSPGDPRRLFALTEALSLYGGAFLPDSGAQWAADRRRQLELRYLDLVGDLASEALIKGQPEKAVGYLRKALAIDPLRDDLNLRYLEALGGLGQVSEIAFHYQRYTRLVREELGIDPPERIRELYSRLIV
jgi:LuxR family maltose regulon positive regulatory protein